MLASLKEHCGPCQNVAYPAKRGKDTQTHRDNFSDHIQTLESVAKTHEFVQRLDITKDKIPTITLYTEDQLEDVKFRFYNYSAVRTAGLAEIQKALDQPQLKLKHACDTRWLSHDMAVTALRRCLPAVVSSLSTEAGERNDAQALGLLKFVHDLHCDV